MDAAVELSDVSVAIDGAKILDGVSWTVRPGERWIVMGPNGSGKTTLLQIVAARRHPTGGSAVVLGSRLGQVDVRALRTRIGVASAKLAASLRPSISAADVVMMGKHAALEPWWHSYTDADRGRARELLELAGLASVVDHPFHTLSEGERQRALVARALMADVDLVVLDEPAAGLDFLNRELLVRQLASLARDASSPPVVMVTHHAEEVPPGFGHALVLARGRVVAAGAVRDVLCSEVLSSAFRAPVAIGRDDDRWWARLQS